MDPKMSRRELIRDVSAASLTFAATAAGEEQGQEQVASGNGNFIRLEDGDMVVIFDMRYGSIRSIANRRDPMQLNFIGNKENTPGLDPSDSRWTGDVISTTWDLRNLDWRTMKWAPNMPGGPPASGAASPPGARRTSGRSPSMDARSTYVLKVNRESRVA